LVSFSLSVLVACVRPPGLTQGIKASESGKLPETQLDSYTKPVRFCPRIVKTDHRQLRAILWCLHTYTLKSNLLVLGEYYTEVPIYVKWIINTKVTK
jgi:hypothetical protein